MTTAPPKATSSAPSPRWTAYAYGFVVVAACTAVARIMFPLFELANLAMIYLLGIVFVATRWGRGPSIFATVLGVTAFDFFYVPPYFSLLSSELKYIVMFAVMMLVGIVISTLTERARIREQDAEHARMEAEVERQRNALLSVVSHDLRTPLATITGAAGALLDDQGPKDAGVRLELLQSIADEGGRLTRLVTNLLDVTRLESGALKPDKQWQLLEEVIGSALSRLESQLGGRKIVTQLPGEPSLVAFDPVLIEQVLINLIENAVKYTPSTTEILIRAQTGAREVTVAVEDRGPGIAAEDTTRIFQKFQRADHATKGNTKWGTGLGLTICKGIVAAHGGRIWAENRKGGGAVFQFTLPIDDNPPSLPATEPTSLP
jgi:K+-sensing histidine kinase KdpD